MTQNDLSSKNREIRQLKKDNAFLRKENARLRKQNVQLMNIGKTLQNMIEQTFKEIKTNNLLATSLSGLRSGIQYN